MTTIRLILLLSSSHNWFIHQLDVNTTFLSGDLHDEVYMKLPPGLKVNTNNLITKLNKSIYVLKHASYQWNTKITNTLIHLGDNQYTAGYSFFTKHHNNCITVILVYVNDLLIPSDKMEEINYIRIVLATKYRIKDLGNIN